MYATGKLFATIKQRVTTSFTSGISPVKLALSITLAILFGVFPFFFIPSLLIILSVFALRLNIAVMLVFNYLAWPLQIILFVPYIHLGNWLFGSHNGDVTLKMLRHTLQADFWGGLHRLLSVILHTAGAWAVSSLPAGLVIFYTVYRIANRLKRPA